LMKRRYPKLFAGERRQATGKTKATREKGRKEK